MTTALSKNGDYLKITANSHTASKNGQVVQMEVPAQNRKYSSMFTFVEIRNGQAIAIGQLFRERRVLSIAAGNISPDMSLDTDPIMEPYNHGKVLFTEYEDGTTKAIYADINGHFIERKMKMSVYSNLIQKLPDQ